MQKSIINSEITKEKAKGSYAPVNGLNMYYETHGTGRPLILLHGGLSETGGWSQILPALAADRQVIGVDLQGHGRTADIDRPMSFEQMADDIATLINYLGFNNTDILGYSLGGGVALQTTIRHPELIRKLVVISTVCKSDGWYPEIRAAMQSMNVEAAKAMVGSPLYQAYTKIAPIPEDWSLLVTKMGRLVSQDYDWSKDMKAIKPPTMIVIGDADNVRTMHAVQFFELLGGGQAAAGWDGSGMPKARLAILPATTHYNIFVSPLLVPIVTPFLDAPMPNYR